MAFFIIDNKKIQMTQDEHLLYQKICKSYTTLTNRGEDLFIDLFEVNDDGIIVFLKPPSKRQTSWEVFLFLISVMNQQHIRCMYTQVADVVKQMNDKLKILDDKLNLLENKK